MFFAALTPLLPHYAHTLALGKGGAGVLSAAYPAGAVLGSIPSGIVAARFGVKRTVLVGLTIVAVCTIVFGFGTRSGSSTSRASARAPRARSRGRARSPGWSPRRRRGGAAP